MATRRSASFAREAPRARSSSRVAKSATQLHSRAPAAGPSSKQPPAGAGRAGREQAQREAERVSVGQAEYEHFTRVVAACIIQTYWRRWRARRQVGPGRCRRAAAAPPRRRRRQPVANRPALLPQAQRERAGRHSGVFPAQLHAGSGGGESDTSSGAGAQRAGSPRRDQRLRPCSGAGSPTPKAAAAAAGAPEAGRPCYRAGSPVLAAGSKGRLISAATVERGLLRGSTGMLQLRCSLPGAEPAPGPATRAPLISICDGPARRQQGGGHRHGGTQRAQGSILQPSLPAGAAGAEAGTVPPAAQLRSSMQSLKLLASKSSSASSSRSGSRRSSLAGCAALRQAAAPQPTRPHSSCGTACRPPEQQPQPSSAPALAEQPLGAGAGLGRRHSLASTFSSMSSLGSLGSGISRSLHQSNQQAAAPAALAASSAPQPDAAERAPSSGRSSISGASMLQPVGLLVGGSEAAPPAPASLGAPATGLLQQQHNALPHSYVGGSQQLAPAEAGAALERQQMQQQPVQEQQPVAASLTAERLSNILSYLDQVEAQVGRLARGAGWPVRGCGPGCWSPDQKRGW
jgi:hypothetical protein